MTKKVSRRDLLKTGSVALSAAALIALPSGNPVQAAINPKAKVYFTDDISPAGLLKIYEKIKESVLGNTAGKVAIKLHTGEPNGPNLLPRELIVALQAKIPNSTVVECNVLYESPRKNTKTHREVLKTNGWDFCPVDIMDADGDHNLSISGMAELLKKHPPGKNGSPFSEGEHLSEVAVGKHFMDYDSMLVYTHFKGHLMGGFGGSLKNISIGCASGKVGKLQIHGKGWPTGKTFLERMVEAGKGMVDHYGSKIAYINVLKNISVDCDCDPNGAKPTCPDIGIMASTDILAVDRASVDMIYALPEKDKKDVVERIESRFGLRQLEHMKFLGMGNDQYEIIRV